MLRILLCALLFGAVLGGAKPAGAYSADATDAAFGALLSMPGAKPTQGKWIIPDDYAVAFDDESQLIERLKELKKQGADFNAMRHRGTLLAHAIRAKSLDRTARWLLRNGAVPKPVLFDDSTTTAYDLARQYKRSAVQRTLEKKYGFRAPQPGLAGAKEVAVPLPPVPVSKRDEAVVLMNTLMAVPYPDKAKQEIWQRFASTLSDAEFAAVFKESAHLESLIRLSRDIEGGLENALARLPRSVVHQNGQQIADLLAEMSDVNYVGKSEISYTPAARAWPALWQRIEQPLRYGRYPYLAERIPPRLWPALYASGYAEQDAALTGCLLASVDLAGFEALWPDFLHFFSNAREEAPALVLSKYRPSFDPQPCYYGSAPAETIAKLAFLQQQGIQAKVRGLSKVRLASDESPDFAEKVGQWLPSTLEPPQLVAIAPRCELALNEAWLTALIKTPVLDQRTLVESVRAIEVPGYSHCALAISGMTYTEHLEVSDGFEYGPSREAWPSSPDAPDVSEIWVEKAGKIQSVETAFSTSEGLIVGQVIALSSGKTYVLRTRSYPRSWGNYSVLPEPYEWQDGVLCQAKDVQQISRRLAAQCEELEANEAPRCRGFFAEAASEHEPREGEAVLAALRQGREVGVLSLIDALGVERRQAYASAIATDDRAAHRALVATGIPPHWTVAEIVSLGQSDLSLKEKRQRVALLFSIKDQLALALNSKRYDLPRSLLSWLPNEDWEPLWQVIGRQPDIWWDAAGSLRAEASKAGRQDLLCDIDRAQGFLCGGGIEFE